MTRAMMLNAKIVRLLHHLRIAEETGEALPTSVSELWNAGKRLQAIRAYREATGLGLKEAKDRLERGHPPPLILLERNVDRLLKHYRLPTESLMTMFPAVKDELAKGRKIHAIKAYREATGAGLREAKEAIDDLAQQLER